MARSGDPLTLSREDLYELVWSKPMTELAQDFGLSDVALAKRCRKLGVPIPGRGYWARVAAGQAPRQPALKKRADDAMDYTALTFDAPREETSPIPPADGAAPHPIRTAIENLQPTDATPRPGPRNRTPWLLFAPRQRRPRNPRSPTRESLERGFQGRASGAVNGEP